MYSVLKIDFKFLKDLLRKDYYCIMENINTEINNMEVDNVSSICIPRVFDNIGQVRIQEVFTKLNIFLIDRVDVVQKQNEKGEKFKRVFVHIKEWLHHSDAQKAKERLLAGKELKIVYDDPWFWKVSINKWVAKPKPEPKPKIRIDFEEENGVEKTELDTRKEKERRNDQYRNDNRKIDRQYRKPSDDNRPRQRPEKQNNKYERKDKGKGRHRDKDYNYKKEQELLLVNANKESKEIQGSEVRVEKIEKEEVMEENVEETISIIKKPREVRTPEQKEMERRANAVLAKICS